MEAQLLTYLMGLIGPWGILIVSVLGSLVVIAQVVVALTPSPDDDKVLAKIYDLPVIGGFLKALITFAPIQKTPKE